MMNFDPRTTFRGRFEPRFAVSGLFSEQAQAPGPRGCGIGPRRPPRTCPVAILDSGVDPVWPNWIVSLVSRTGSREDPSLVRGVGVEKVSAHQESTSAQVSAHLVSTRGNRSSTLSPCSFIDRAVEQGEQPSEHGSSVPEHGGEVRGSGTWDLILVGVDGDFGRVEGLDPAGRNQNPDQLHHQVWN
jgi:hypothetical protein